VDRKEVTDVQACNNCGKNFVVEDGNIAFREDPYNSEINGNHTEMWLCDDCYSESCDDI
jgi:hypothetical protein